VATSSAATQPVRTASGREALPLAAYALGGVGLAGEAVVHVQQYFSLYHQVSWIGPLFLINAVACIVAIAGLSYAPTRGLAALAGIVISLVALVSLVVSYGNGLFGWQEAGWRPAITWIVVAEAGAVLFLAAALAWPSRLEAPRAVRRA